MTLALAKAVRQERSETVRAKNAKALNEGVWQTWMAWEDATTAKERRAAARQRRLFKAEVATKHPEAATSPVTSPRLKTAMFWLPTWGSSRQVIERIGDVVSV